MTTQQKISKHSNKALVGALCLTSVIIFSAAVLSPANSSTMAPKAKDALIGHQNQVMKYDVYAGGFHVVSADLTIDMAKKSKYHLRLGAYTHGILAKLAPWKGVFETNGHYDSKKFMPKPYKHASDTTWRDEKELVEFVYNNDGSFKEHRIFNDKQKGIQPPLPELSKDSTDVLTATLAIMNKLSHGEKCEGADKIFDGARSYKLAFKEVGKENLTTSALNVYSGPTTKCTVEVEPIAGKWHEKPRGWMSIQEQGRERGTMPTVWFGKMAENEPAIPVKIMVKTQYGALMMHLTHYEGAGKNLALAKD